MLSIGVLLLFASWFGQSSSTTSCSTSNNVTLFASEVQSLFEYLTTLTNATGYVPPQTGMETPELIQSYGYPSEIHTITTDDGYILTYHRIPYGIKGNSSAARRPPVLLQHGLFSESTHWCIQNEGSVLPLLLADLDFDVWLGNARGNRYSRGNTKYTTADPEFWETGWTEMGMYDIPAGIDYILSTTGAEEISYVGHSMGTTMYFAMCSERPEHCAKVNYMVAYGPVTYANNIRSPVRVASAVLGLAGAQDLLITAGQGEFFPEFITKYISDFAPAFCNSEVRGSLACATIMFVLMGFDYCQMNSTLIPLIVATGPSSSTSQAMVQYFQEMNCLLTPCFQKVDHGALENLDAYGSATPPQFNFANIDTPKTLYIGANDWLATSQDNENTEGKMPNTDYVTVANPDFNHLDFLWATDAKALLYDDTIALLLAANGLPPASR